MSIVLLGIHHHQSFFFFLKNPPPPKFSPLPLHAPLPILAPPSTVFQDKPHFEFGIVSGDGVHLLWQEAIGTIRGRYFIFPRQELDAETAKAWGAVKIGRAHV